MQQLVANQAAQSNGARDGRDARERQMRKFQLVDASALWKKTGSQQHWIIRGRIRHYLGDSPADIQAFVGEAIHVTARVAAQLRSLSDFDVALFRSRTDVSTEGWIMVVDRLELLGCCPLGFRLSCPPITRAWIVCPR